MGSAHSSCAHPLAPNVMQLMSNSFQNYLNIHGSKRGIEMGWFFWPINFDPVWLLSCWGHTPKEEKWTVVYIARLEEYLKVLETTSMEQAKLFELMIEKLKKIPEE